MPGIKIQKAILRKSSKMLKLGGSSVMIWGCMSWPGADGMSRVTGMMKSEQLTGILTTCFVPTVEEVAKKAVSTTGTTLSFSKTTMPNIQLGSRRIG